jgi:DNA-binding SARP family transcriptional activator
VEFALLGPVEARIGGRPVNLGVRRGRFVLAVLALEVNKPVEVARLVDLVWPDDPPATARAMIQTTVSGLRVTLSHLGADRHGVRLCSSASGYCLQCDPARIDVHRFRALLDSARAAAGDEVRLALLEQALSLWRGQALAGTATPQARARLFDGLQEARLAALEERYDIRLRLGREDPPIDELVTLTGEHPYRPRFAAALMLALHRTGRSADALAVFEQARRRLADDFGLDMPADLRQLQMAILRNSPGLGPPAAARPPAPEPPEPEPAAPAQLPADVATFTGRQAELTQLLGAAETADPAPVITIDGMPGVGKTALAVRAGHLLSAAYPDGQLFLDLHGHASDSPPVDPASALHRLLRSLGIPDQHVPADVEGRSALLRSSLTGRRILILLDNAADEEQVEPLLPGRSGCLVLVTSRRRLAGLDGVHPVQLDVLPLPDAVALFDRAAGRRAPDHARAELLAEVADLCGRLPLALRLAAERLRNRPVWTVEHLAERLRNHRTRLVELRAGPRSVAAAFELSYTSLDREQRDMFRRLGLHLASHVDPATAAVLADVSCEQAESLLEDLLDRHLLRQDQPGRYVLHELLWVYATALAARLDPPRQQQTTLTRLLRQLLTAAAAAMDLLSPQEHLRRPPARALDWAGVGSLEAGPAAGGSGGWAFVDAETASCWLAAEEATLAAAVRWAAAHGAPRLAWQLADELCRYYGTRRSGAGWLDCAETGLVAAEQDGSAAGQAALHLRVAEARWYAGDYRRAADHYSAALDLARRIGWPGAESGALRGLGITCGQRSTAPRWTS